MSDTFDEAMQGAISGMFSGFCFSGGNPVGALFGGFVGAVVGCRSGHEKVMEYAGKMADDTRGSADLHMPFSSPWSPTDD